MAVAWPLACPGGGNTPSLRASVPGLVVLLALAAGASQDDEAVSWLQNTLTVHKEVGGARKQSVSAGRPPVFYLGPQKSGTTSFAHFMGTLGYHSVHGIESSVKNSLYPEGWAACASSAGLGANSAYPLHEALVSEMEPGRRAAFAASVNRSSDNLAAADEAWPFLFRFLDEITEGRGKFVIWRRDPLQWADSWIKQFGVHRVNFDRFFLLSYGNGCASELDRQQLASAYSSHISAVLTYFNSSPSRRNRLLDLDFASPDAGYTLCSFALGNNTELCRPNTHLPDSQVDDISPIRFQVGADDIVQHALLVRRTSPVCNVHRTCEPRS